MLAYNNAGAESAMTAGTKKEVCYMTETIDVEVCACVYRIRPTQ